ncbi:translation initiation factor IF-2 [Thermodesulfobacteriota bacterium]
MAKKIGLDALALELGYDPLNLFMKLNEQGFDFDTPSSMITTDMVSKIKAKLESLEEPKEKTKKPVVIRRKKPIKVEPEPVEEVSPEEPPAEEPVEAKEEEKEVVEPPPAEEVAATKESAEPSEKKTKKKQKKGKATNEIEIPELETLEAKEKSEKEKPQSDAAKKGKKKGKAFEDAKAAKKRPKKAEFTYEERYVPKMGKGHRSFSKHKRRKTVQGKHKQTEITIPKAIKKVIKVEESIVVGELSQRMGIKTSEVIKKLFDLGVMATINQAVDVDTASFIATEFGYEVEKIMITLEDVIETEEDTPEQLKLRPPVVTIMGHVDHGKTSLLDAIREGNVTAGEAGGITQHIGAYEVMIHDDKIAFLDTPGHEAFTAMRARGAEVTDIVILVVAADDGVMPQTKEAINHAKAAGVPIIVAINKIDKENADPQRIKQDLMSYELVSEEWGGDTIFAEVSAKQKTGINHLLEMILLQAEVLELKANPDKPAKGVVVESKLDKGLGPVATVLVQEGTLHKGDTFIMGAVFGKVRALINDKGRRVKSAGPSTPVEVLGLTDTPVAGDEIYVVSDEKKAKAIITQRQQRLREKELAKSSKITLEELYERIQNEDIQELNIILKADVQGSCQALREALHKVSMDEIKIKVIHESVGGITESDIMLAAASNAIVIGFNVRPQVKASALAEKEKVDVRLYSVIYDLVHDIQQALRGLLAPITREAVTGHAEVREVFSVPKIGKIAGSFLTDGKFTRNSKVRVLRDDVVIYDGKISSLKRFKDDAKEVVSGYECGIGVENFNDIKNGDVLESYIIEEVAREYSD